MSFYINKNCIGCAFCHNECPKNAIYFNGDQYAIEPNLCINCGKCRDLCLMSAVSDSQFSEPRPEQHETLHKSCDFLVIGGGASGLIAAARFAELTGKKVIVLEKNKKPGGSGYFAVGLNFANTQMERDAGIPDTIDDLVRSAMNATNWQLNSKLVEGCFKALGETFDWLCQWANPEETWSLGVHPMTGKPGIGLNDHRRGSGRFMTAKLVSRIGQLGGELLTEHTATRLLTEDGCVIGAVVEDPGGETIITCKACMLCTGSLIRSELLKKQIPAFADTRAKRYAHDAPYLTGDALTLASQAGIPLNLDSLCLAFVGCMPVAFHEMPFHQGQRVDALKINLDGKRWCNEGVNQHIAAEKLLEQPQSVSYTIMDSDILSSPMLMLAGGAPGMGPFPPTPQNVVPFEGMYPDGIPDFAAMRGETFQATPEVMKHISEQVGDCVCYGKTIEELAEQLHINPQVLTATVDRYNALCAKGRDDDFFKQPELMKPIQRGPFFAIRSYLYLDGAFGGLSVNEHMEIIGSDGPVSGLYAAGDIVSSRYINDAHHKNQITNDYSWAIASGFIAGRSASVYLKD